MQNQERQERHFGRIFSSGAEFVKNAKSEVHRTGAHSGKDVGSGEDLPRARST